MSNVPADDDDAAEHDRITWRQRSGSDRHWRDEQNRKWILNAAGQIEQGGKLQNIVDEQPESKRRAEPMARRIADRQKDIEPRRQGDEDQTASDIEWKAVIERDKCNRDELPEHRRPAQPDARNEPKLAVSLG